jgi:Cu+-exporting ATPase
MKSAGVLTEPLAQEVEQLRGQGRTVIFLSVDSKLAGAIAVGDPVKETTPAALQALKEDGLKLIMLTGDNAATARAVAADLPIDEVIAEVQPKDKADVIARLQSQGASVAMAVMASTTHRRSPRHMSASLWERGLTIAME